MEEWRLIDKALLTYAKNPQTHSVTTKNKNVKSCHAYGIDIGERSLRQCSKQAVVHTPSRLSNAVLKHNSEFGAFSYITEGTVHNTEIGPILLNC